MLGRAWLTCAIGRQSKRRYGGQSKALGPIDILGELPPVSITPLRLARRAKRAAERMIDVNLKGTFNVINAIAPNMQKARQGKDHQHLLGRGPRRYKAEKSLLCDQGGHRAP